MPFIAVLISMTGFCSQGFGLCPQKALEEAMHRDGQQRRTVLVIAHRSFLRFSYFMQLGLLVNSLNILLVNASRLSTIRLADRIVVMQGGRVSEVNVFIDIHLSS